MFTVVGNYDRYCSKIIEDYPLPEKKFQYCWSEQRYGVLPTTMMKICHDACVKSGEEELLKSDPFVIVERHHNILYKDGKVKNHFAPHTDREGPANGPCHSILYYYQIDEGIDDVGLHFYEWIDEDKEMIDQDGGAVATFTPVTGDVVTFGDSIPHCPGEFKTDSETPKVRGVLAIFIKHPQEEKRANAGCMRCLPCLY